MKIFALVGGLSLLILGVLYVSQDSVDTSETTTETPAESVNEINVTEDDIEKADEDVSEEDFVVEDESSDVSFDLVGTNYAFSVEEVRVKEGDMVTINFVSEDGFHDWVVDEFDAATEKVRPGTPTSVTFVADKAGTYEFYCSVGSHRAQGMVGSLIVE